MCVPALGLIGGIISGIGAAAQASAAAASAEANANMQERQAQIEQQTGAYKAARQQDQVDRVGGQQRAAYGAGGISLTSGSADAVLSESVEEGALDVAAIRWNSSLAAGNSRYAASVSRMNAANARSSIPLAFAAPVINAASSNIATYGGVFG